MVDDLCGTSLCAMNSPTPREIATMPQANIIHLPSSDNPLARLDAAFADYRALALQQIEMARGSVVFDFAAAESQLHDQWRVVEREAEADLLSATRPESDVVDVNGTFYKRLAEETPGNYLGLYGDIVVSRSLYRQVGVRNGPTIDPIALRCGLVDGDMTPAAAVAFGRVAQLAPWRECADLCDSFGVLPYSRSTLQRKGLRVGTLWDEACGEIEEKLIADFEIPDDAAAVSISVDRVSVPMAEDREPTAEDRKRGVEHPIKVVKRMSYCGVWTLHDRNNRSLHSVRYSYAANRGSDALEASLRGDLHALIAKRPDLRIVTLGDGAVEMQSILDRITAGFKVAARKVDFWHCVEKLAAAAKTIDADNTKATVGRFTKALFADDGAIDEIEQELLGWTDRFDDDDIPEDLLNAVSYIFNNRERMRYASTRAAGLPIGSGHVEATCKTIVSVRCKRSGSRWRPPGLQSVLGLRALATSSRWNPAMKELVTGGMVPVREAA